MELLSELLLGSSDPVLTVVGVGVLLFLLLWFPRALLSVGGGALIGGLFAFVLAAVTGYAGDQFLLPSIIAGGLFGFLLLR